MYLQNLPFKQEIDVLCVRYSPNVDSLPELIGVEIKGYFPKVIRRN
jgi:hypothetical protein